ncbi:hypothetical protein [Streptococcus equi]|uniref:hypothetical protein n=1 Tax=Streptococcus equi TaxID=1336 RepID=UPI001BB6D597|nr:hypothetical protein [Streptococcus equi]HEM6084515.1 hypothetical protein [Streptococcus suis]MCD3380260.1 hypothetical protein [Streptococcus equi subsp. zooepidemicus]MCD3385115.1 hypothetical protein [Streptococcus equi subsp. zooepidemicus]MCD3390091.1 hypothetical protein [Streptococcus equi subsp. zooepidemicus]MCD3393534.1 hypothetical protein [Streptococcus equi subsp. zooepidemicus]
MKIYKFMFYITYPALVYSIYLLLDLTNEYGTPLVETFFIAGGVIGIPLLLWLIDVVSTENDKVGVSNDKTITSDANLEKSEA